MQHSADADAVCAYGVDEPSYGGVYFDGDVLVAMFTENLQEHQARLVPVLQAPDQFRLAAADRPYAEVEGANARVQQTLRFSGLHRVVTGVGIALVDGQFAIRVEVVNCTDDVVESIRARVAPDVVVVKAGLRARRL